MLKASGTKRLKLQHDEPLSSSAFKFNLRRYNLGITSDEALSLGTQPKRVIVIGGGYIAVEFAGIYNGLGSEVQIVYRQPLPLRGFDEEVRQTVANNLEGRGVKAGAYTRPLFGST